MAQLKMPSRHKVLQLDPMDGRPAGELTSYPFLLEKTEGMTGKLVKLVKLSKLVKLQDESLATGSSSIKQSPDISSMPGISGPLGCWSVQLCQAI